MRRNIGEILIDEGLIDRDQLGSGVGEQRQWGGKLGEILVKKGFLRKEDLMRCLAIQQGIKTISISDISISPAALRSMSLEDAKKYNVLPISAEKHALTVAVTDPTDLKTVDTLGFKTGKKIRVVLALEGDIRPLIIEHYMRLSSKSYAGESGYKASERDPHLEAGSPVEGRQKPGDASITVENTLASLIKLLVRKGLISEQELLDLMKEKR
jgi:hypothetical protein